MASWNKKLIVILCVLFSQIDARAVEEEPIIIEGLQAIHSTPKETAKGAVLLIHGWASQMNEVGNLYQRLAERLAVNNIASLRVNIRGESEQASSNYTLTSTFSSRLNDAKLGLEFLKKHYLETPIAAVGFSLGGSTAIALAGQQPESLQSLVLWSSGGNPKNVADSLLNEQERVEVQNKGSVVLKKWVNITVTKQHLNGFYVNDIFQSLQNYNGALLCIRGTEDYVPDIDRKIMSAASGSVKESRYIYGADHIFNVLDPRSSYDERVLDQTAEWLINTLD